MKYILLSILSLFFISFLIYANVLHETKQNELLKDELLILKNSNNDKIIVDFVNKELANSENNFFILRYASDIEDLNKKLIHKSALEKYTVTAIFGDDKLWKIYVGRSKIVWEIALDSNKIILSSEIISPSSNNY